MKTVEMLRKCYSDECQEWEYLSTKYLKTIENKMKTKKTLESNPFQQMNNMSKKLRI